MDARTLAITPSKMATAEKAEARGRSDASWLFPKGPPQAIRGPGVTFTEIIGPPPKLMLARGFPLAFITPGPIQQRDAWYAFFEPVRCPCGWARRAFADVPNAPASVHRVEVEVDARTHYHREHTETYYILECAAGAAIRAGWRASARDARPRGDDPAGGPAPGRRPDDDPERRRTAVRPGR